jgi:NADH-ubiquinone oxidoreductase chain 2
MLISSLLLILLSNAVTFRRDKSILYSRIVIIILLISSLITYKTLSFISLNKGIGLYGGLFQATTLSHSFQIFIFLISSIIIQLTGFYPIKLEISNHLDKYILYNTDSKLNTKIVRTREQFNIIEYPLILLFIITGAIFLISSNDIVSIFLSIELQSYGLYLLSTIYRNSELATSAGLTYFLLGGLSSCFILLGLSLLYTNSGITSLEGYYILTNISNVLKDSYKDIINFSLILISVGFLFKISAAPFHFWSPDVYDAIPTIVTTFVAIITKISILIFLLELINYTYNVFSHSLSFNFNWTSTLLISSLLSLIIGTVLGLNQSRIKRLYAYSTIAHLGFILLALSINKLESIQAFIFYLTQYSISNLNAFIILISIGFTLTSYHSKKNYDNLIDENYSPIQLISQLKGYFYINPLIAISLTITIYSFVGIPPLIGFFAKQMVLSAALDNGYVFITLIAILTSVISAVYYLMIIKQMFFDKADYEKNFNFIITLSKIEWEVKSIKLTNIFSITISIITLIILLFMFNPQEWLSITNILALLTFNP